MPILTLDRLADIASQQWDDLLTQANPFLSHAFLSALEDSGSVGAHCGWQPAHRLLRDASGTVLAALPAYIKSHSYGEYVFDMGWADACHRAGIGYYPKLLGAVPFSPVTGPRLLGDPAWTGVLLDELEASLGQEGLSGLHINFLREEDDALFTGRAGWLQRLDCQYHWLNHGYRDFQDFLDALSSRKRKQLRKEREQVAGQGLEFRWQCGNELNEADWDFVYACYADTYQVRGRTPYLTRAFFSLLAERMAPALRVVFALRGGRPVAMAFSLVQGGVFYGRYWGCLADFDRLHFETCFYQGIELAIAEGLQRFDAGAQGEHKLIRGFEPVITRSWHYLLHPGLRTAVADFLGHERTALLEYAQQARSLLPYRQGES